MQYVHLLQGKAGMELLVRIAARLYAKKGINCNAVIPGLVLAGKLDHVLVFLAVSLSGSLEKQ